MDEEILAVLNRNLQAIWDGDTETYAQTCAEDVSFFEWYVTTQRIDGLDFHLRELRVHSQALGGGDVAHTEHEILQPRVQRYGDTAIVTYTLLVRSLRGADVTRTQQNETRVFQRFAGLRQMRDRSISPASSTPVFCFTSA